MNLVHAQGDMFTPDPQLYKTDKTNSGEIEYISEYSTIYGMVLNSDIKRDRVEIQVFALDDSTCTWQLTEKYKDNEFLLTIDRDTEYQVWFNNGYKYKILYIDPGYYGNFAYRINANFTTSQCARMTPTENGLAYDVNYLNVGEINHLMYNQNYNGTD